MYGYCRNEMKVYASQAISEIQMVEYSDFFENMKNYLKLLSATKVVYLLISLQM